MDCFRKMPSPKGTSWCSWRRNSNQQASFFFFFVLSWVGTSNPRPKIKSRDFIFLPQTDFTVHCKFAMGRKKIYNNPSEKHRAYRQKKKKAKIELNSSSKPRIIKSNNSSTKWTSLSTRRRKRRWKKGERRIRKRVKKW
jgi:hypothetical protein